MTSCDKLSKVMGCFLQFYFFWTKIIFTTFSNFFKKKIVFVVLFLSCVYLSQEKREKEKDKIKIKKGRTEKKREKQRKN